MKKHLLFLFCLIFVVGCRSYEVKVTHDKFTKSKVIKLEMWHRVVDGRLDNHLAIYSRQVKDGKSSPTQVFFKFRVKGQGPGGLSWGGRTVELDETAYILIDNESYKLYVSNRQRDRTLHIWGDGDSVWGGTSDDLFGVVELGPKIAEKIKTAQEVQYRFFASGETATLRAEEDQLEKMKEFFME